MGAVAGAGNRASVGAQAQTGALSHLSPSPSARLFRCPTSRPPWQR